MRPPVWGPTINTPGGLLSIRPPTGADQLWCPAESVTSARNDTGPSGCQLVDHAIATRTRIPIDPFAVPTGVPSANSCTDDTPWSSATSTHDVGVPLRKPTGASIVADGAR